MYKELFLHHSSRRAAFKSVAVVCAVALLLIGTIEKVKVAGAYVWIALPLLFLGLAEAGYGAEQRRCAELFQKNKGADDFSVLSSEPPAASCARITLAVFSLSVWPFYLGLFALVVFGGEKVAQINRQAMAKAVQAFNTSAPGQPYIQTSAGPVIPSSNSQRPGNGANPSNHPPLNSALQRGIPSTPPHFPTPNRPPVTPMAPATSPNSLSGPQ